MRWLGLAALLLAAGCDRPRDCRAIPGDICTWAGDGHAGYDGEGNHRLQAMLYFPMYVSQSPHGPPVIDDWNNHRLRLVEDDGTLTTIMGTDFVGDGPPDEADLTPAGAPGTEVALNHPTQHQHYADGTLLSASWHTHKLRTWDPDTGLTHVLLGNLPGFAGDEGEGDDEVRLNQPKAVAIDADDNVYIVDMRNVRVRLLTPEGAVRTIAGNGTKGDCGDGGLATEACLSFPRAENPEPGGALAFSADETLLYIADTENHRIRVLDLETGIIDAFAGTGEPGFAGDGGDADEAQFQYPRDLALSPDGGTLFVADTDNHRIRAIDLDSHTVQTVAGVGTRGFSGDESPALDAELNRPFGISVDAEGRLYVADTFNHRIRIVFP